MKTPYSSFLKVHLHCGKTKHVNIKSGIMLECNLVSHLGTERGWHVGNGTLALLIIQFSSAWKMKKLLCEDLTCCLDVLSSKQKTRWNQEGRRLHSNNSPSNDPDLSQPLMIALSCVYVL